MTTGDSGPLASPAGAVRTLEAGSLSRGLLARATEPGLRRVHQLLALGAQHYGDYDDPSAAIRIIDTAPEVNGDRAVGYLREAYWALVL
jgi:hypothetical protein